MFQKIMEKLLSLKESHIYWLIVICAVVISEILCVATSWVVEGRINPVLVIGGILVPLIDSGLLILFLVYLIRELRTIQNHLEEIVEERTEKLKNEIAERKKTEEKLRKSEERFNLAVKGSNDGLWDWEDLSIETVWFSPKVYEMMGYESDGLELNFSSIRKYTYEGDFERLNETLQLHLKNFLPFDMELRLMTQSDGYRWFRARGQAIWDSEGTPVRMSGSLQDITDLKEAEQERARLAMATEQAAEAILIMDAAGEIIYVNPAFEIMTGFSPEEIAGKNFQSLNFDEKEDNAYTEAWIQVEKGETWSGRFINKRKDESFFHVEATVAPIKNAAGDIRNFVSVQRDVTQELKLEEKLRQSQKMESIGTLAGGIAHDFNNILTSIIGFAELALDEAEKGSFQFQNLNEVLIAGNRAKDLVRQILTFSRQSEQELKPLQISLIVKEAFRLLRASIPSTVDMKQNIRSNSLVMGDPTQIHQVVMNLCTNAAHAMEEKGGTLKLSLVDVNIEGCEPDLPGNLPPGEYLRLSVTDTGHGMSADVVDRIFDPFFTTKEQGKGTGMGLSVVHGIVKACKGEIAVSSVLRKGTRFDIYFPVAERGIFVPSETIDNLPTGTERILMVDDEEQIVRMGERFLSKLGYAVTSITDSTEALRLFLSEPDRFDLVITDMTMPRLTGTRLSEKMLEVKPELPIILCTGFSASVDEKTVDAIGIKGFLSKPMIKKEMAVTIRKVLENAETDRLKAEAS